MINDRTNAEVAELFLDEDSKDNGLLDVYVKTAIFAAGRYEEMLNEGKRIEDETMHLLMMDLLKHRFLVYRKSSLDSEIAQKVLNPEG